MKALDEIREELKKKGANGDSRIMTAKEAFEIIKKDWEARYGEKDG